jgi:hypothetical protein
VKRISLGAIFLLLAGCTAHYYKICDDRVIFFLKMPNARIVYFASSLDQFELHPAKKISSGMWEITLPASREFRYFYKVDGFVYLPNCKLSEKDDFGTENCIFVPYM